MKSLCLLICLIICILPVSADTVITGGVKYNVKSAGEELSVSTRTKINKNIISANIYDFRRNENVSNLLNGNVSLYDRTLALFSDNTYAVMYLKDPLHVFYYSHDGVLLFAEEKESIDYPYKSYKYDTFGKLVNKTLRVSKNETFIFTPEGKLIAHWINNNGYDENGNVIMTRKYVR